MYLNTKSDTSPCIIPESPIRVPNWVVRGWPIYWCHSKFTWLNLTGSL